MRIMKSIRTNMKSSYDLFGSNRYQKRNTFSNLALAALKKGFIQLLKLDYHTVSLKMRHYDVLRGQVFIDDVIESFDECPESFSLADLIIVLFDDLLSQVKRGSLSHKQVAHILMDGKSKYFTHIHEIEAPKKKEFIQVSPYLYRMYEVEDDNDIETIADDDFVYVDIRLRESFINRAKVLLYELQPYFGNVPMTLEEMMVIRYLHFLHLIKTEGNDERVIKTILLNLGYL
jgi:hypothetical protein